MKIPLAGLVLGLFLAPPMWAVGLDASRVLVIYNSRDADSGAVWDHYSAMRPGVHGCDLDDPGLTPGTVSYPEFVARVRDPVRAHLAAEGLAEQVVVLVLTKGLPHRIQDIGAANIGDDPGGAYNRINAGNASYASVDSELTLLWQDLDDGEGGGAMDSPADNRVTNPYFNRADPVTSYNRSAITSTKHFQNAGNRWTMKQKNNGALSTAGDFYLVSRLDGNSVAAVIGMINRGLAPWYEPEVDQLIQDKNAASSYDGGDYSVTDSLMSPAWPAFVYEQTNTFLIGQNGNLPAGNTGTSRVTGRVAALTGYGGNHDGYNRSGFMATYTGQLSNGAVYNAYESFNARKFGGVGGFGDHGQLSDWIDAGGTFGVGSAWEPLASGAPKNYALLKRYFVDGLSWVESAWSSAQYLSWQTVVIGDPLAVASFTAPPTATVSASGSLSEMGGSGATAVVQLTAPAAADTQVLVSFSGAEAGEDFEVVGCAAGCVTVPAQAQSASFDLVALADDLPEGTEMLEIRIEPGGGYQASALAVVLPIEDTPFGAWSMEQFGAGAGGPDSQPDADPDGDRLGNLLEYAMGLDPLVSDVSGGPELSIESGGTGSEAVYRFQIDPAASDIGWRVERSSDLTGWTSQAAGQTGSQDLLHLMEARRPVDGPRCFFRLVVWQLDP